jgi:hypothetical protein
VFEKRVLRRIFGHNTEVAEGGRKMHNELHDLYTSLNIIRVVNE